MQVNGIDVYADVNTIDSYINSHYMSSSPIKQYWSGLDDNDKACFCIQLTQFIDSLPLIGYKLSRTQPLGLPRRYKSVTLDFSQDLLRGTLETLYTAQASDASEYETLRQQGVKSYSVEGSSITFQDAEGVASLVGSRSSLTSTIPTHLYKYFSRYVY